MTAWMKPILRPLTSARFDVLARRLACWVAAIWVLVLAVTMQMILIGLVLPQSGDRE